MRITLPIILPGVLAGAIFAFITSWDEVVVAIFLTSARFRTLPVEMWEQVRQVVDPTVAAVSTTLLVVTTVLLLLLLVVRRQAPVQMTAISAAPVAPRPGWRASRTRPARSPEVLRRRDRGRRRRPRGPPRRVRHAPRPIGFGQDDDAPYGGGLHGPERRLDRDRRQRHDAGPAVPPRRRHGVPELRVVPAHDGRPEHRLPPPDATNRAARDHPPGRRRAGPRQAREIRGSLPAPAIGRPAAANRPRPGRRLRAAVAPHGRAARARWIGSSARRSSWRSCTSAGSSGRRCSTSPTTRKRRS